MSDSERVELRELRVTGKDDNGQPLVATMFEHVEHHHKLQVYLLANGYDVEEINPGVHATPPTGDVSPSEYSLNEDLVKHHRYMVDVHGDDYDPAEHVGRLRAQKGNR